MTSNDQQFSPNDAAFAVYQVHIIIVTKYVQQLQFVNKLNNMCMAKITVDMPFSCRNSSYMCNLPDLAHRARLQPFYRDFSCYSLRR
jgi:hypothetical protein